ncbi:Uncharacterised protein [Anaerotruncus sp. 2789STDY5834896]|uniref:Uncharacterized protein n=1 Tax=uncultured Anaerotruncus sp. TaxID=905011 RepID=A0A1C6K4F5_9FIRM|nr:Uncharacterised protein [uncultured Anaerotruncus sp.]
MVTAISEPEGPTADTLHMPCSSTYTGPPVWPMCTSFLPWRSRMRVNFSCTLAGAPASSASIDLRANLSPPDMCGPDRCPVLCCACRRCADVLYRFKSGGRRRALAF